jgi:polyferredoxin
MKSFIYEGYKIREVKIDGACGMCGECINAYRVLVEKPEGNRRNRPWYMGG